MSSSAETRTWRVNSSSVHSVDVFAEMSLREILPLPTCLFVHTHFPLCTSTYADDWRETNSPQLHRRRDNVHFATGNHLGWTSHLLLAC